MKNTIIWSALFTLMGTQTYAEPVPSATPQQTPTTVNAAPAQPAAIPSAPIPNMPAPAPTINCDYRIPAQTKVDQGLVLNWAEKAVIQSFSFDPLTLDNQMKKLQSCFTEQGWTGFNAALQKSGNIEAIKSQKLMVTSHIDGQILVNEAKDNQWKLTLPLVVVYQNEKEKVSQLLSVDLTVGRKINGDLGITQMIAAPRGTVTTKKPVESANPDATNLDTPPPPDEPEPIIGKPH